MNPKAGTNTRAALIKDDSPHGQGTFTWANGDVYEGEMADNYQNGVGTMAFANGDVYTGHWENGEMNGKGTYTHAETQSGWKHGRAIKGVFAQGQFPSSGFLRGGK